MEVATTEEKFYSAVELIKKLPKSGPIKPSTETKLKFYSLFKQATEGPCELGRPGFWDVVNRAKWDAWSKLGNMSKEDAMLKYVEAFIKVIQETPLDTLDDPSVLEDYANVMGPYISFAPKAIQEKHVKMNGKANFNNNIEDDYEITSHPNQSHVNVSKREDFGANGHHFNGNNESDSEEFSDTLERVEDVIDAENNCATGPSFTSIRGGGELPPRVNDSTPRNAAASNSGISPPQNSSTTNTSNVYQLPQNYSLIGGAGGSRRGGGYPQLGSNSDVNDQLAMAVIRMQHTMELVINRLDSLESLLLQNRNTFTSSLVSSKNQSPWTLFGIPPKILIPFIMLWPFVAPFIAQWLMRLIRKRQRLLR